MLEVRDMRRYFGGVKAVDGISFQVNQGECVALIGPNGAGKSTSFACMAGQQNLDAGEVRWLNRRIDTCSTAERLALGVARTFQVAQVFEALSVRQNVQLVLPTGRRLQAWNRLRDCAREQADALLAQVDLLSRAEQVAGALPYGARKRLELALALASAPRLLLLDEPAAGLAANERERLMRLIQTLAHPPASAQTQPAPGLAVLYTEHNMDAVFGVADRVLVMMDGLLVAQGTAEEVARMPLVRERYLGVHWRMPQSGQGTPHA
jgi:branched-chain amino acid transport system ATP-binding protein